MTEKTKDNPRRVRTPMFRMSYPSLLKPRQYKDDETGVVRERYELTMLFPPGSDMKPMQRAARAAMSEKYGDDQSKWPKMKRKLADVIRDFGEYNSESDKPLPGDWSGWIMVRANATTKYAPNIVGHTKSSNGTFPVITDEREVYGGRWAKATIEFYVYERKDGRGLTVGLGNVQLLKHDTPFGGAVTSAERDFDDATEEEAGAGDAFDSGEKSSTDDDEMPF